tara:strand:- start:388 stop:1152 length:765 start_codon:yes stop_codon:yes gene_type:complete
MFGTSMHEVLQFYLHIMYTQSIKEADSIDVEDLLRKRMQHHYERIMKQNGGEVFCTENDMVEFFQDGCDILDWFKRRRAQYFSKKGYELVGIETELNYKMKGNVVFKGYIDLVVHDTVRDKYLVYDIKTSTKGWNKYQKKDKNKTDQLLLYKQFYSLQMKVPIDKIEVEFFIVKRKLWENVDFPQRRVQKVIPASGKPSINRVLSNLNTFLEECFDENGEYLKDTIYRKEPSQKNCRYCEFKNKKELCDRKREL